MTSVAETEFQMLTVIKSVFCVQADPEDGVSYASISYTKKSDSKGRVSCVFGYSDDVNTSQERTLILNHSSRLHVMTVMSVCSTRRSRTKYLNNCRPQTLSKQTNKSSN